MISRLFTTVSTPASAAHRVPWAIVACLAWMVLGRLGTAQNLSGLPSAQPTASGASAVDTGAAGSLGRPVQFASTAAQTSATGPVLNDPAAGPLQSGDVAGPDAGGESLAGPTAEELPSSGAAAESPYWTRMWRFVPRGMVPFGPAHARLRKRSWHRQPAAGPRLADQSLFHHALCRRDLWQPADCQPSQATSQLLRWAEHRLGLRSLLGHRKAARFRGLESDQRAGSADSFDRTERDRGISADVLPLGRRPLAHPF